MGPGKELSILYLGMSGTVSVNLEEEEEQQEEQEETKTSSTVRDDDCWEE